MEMDFHEKIKEQRKVMNLTQKEIASSLGIGQDLYSRYENGKLSFPSTLIPELCYFLEMTPNELFEYERYVKIYHDNNSKKRRKKD
jgi:transcriptional regulator with XRE-family HTH domain